MLSECVELLQTIENPRCKFPLQLVLLSPEEMVPLMYGPTMHMRTCLKHMTHNMMQHTA